MLVVEPAIPFPIPCLHPRMFHIRIILPGEDGRGHLALTTRLLRWYSSLRVPYLCASFLPLFPCRARPLASGITITSMFGVILEGFLNRYSVSSIEEYRKCSLFSNKSLHLVDHDMNCTAAECDPFQSPPHLCLLLLQYICAAKNCS